MNSTNNDLYKNAALKVFAQLGQLIKEDENKNVKPKPVNLLDLSTDILNTIGDIVKKDNEKREREEIEN